MAGAMLDQIKKLRDMTGVGMMDCKKALHEAEGDIAKAEELLRKKGIKIAQKRAGNATDNGRAEGWVSSDYQNASLIEVLD